MPTALIGYSGFVGSTLLRQTQFDSLYRSTNISDISGKKFDTVVCAGAPAQKWLANREPHADRKNIEALISHLKTVQCSKFILISTVDVFKYPRNVDETTLIDPLDLHPYGLHRRLLETFVESHFSNHLIVRLPGLVGPGLRKNIIFDFMHSNNLSTVESRGVFQFYPMVNLWQDIQTAIQCSLRLVHLTAAPISVADIAKYAFGQSFNQQLDQEPPAYDVQTQHALAFGASGKYQYSARETLLATRAYVQAARINLKINSGLPS